jgi:hypothetical protein
MRWKLYLRQTYTTPGIYVKTTLFALSDQAHNTFPEWGGGVQGFATRFASRQGQFIVQNSVSSFGFALAGSEPRYYLGAFAGSVVSTTWKPGSARIWTEGYQGIITQVPIGIGINFLGEFAPEITRIIRKKNPDQRTTPSPQTKAAEIAAYAHTAINGQKNGK